MPISRETLLELVRPLKNDKRYFRVGVWDGDASESPVAVISLNPRNAITTDDCSPEEFCDAISNRATFAGIYENVDGESKAREHYDRFRRALGNPNVVETNISAYPTETIERGDLKEQPHVEGMKRASAFHSLLRPQFLLIAPVLPWELMVDSGLLDLDNAKVEAFQGSRRVSLEFKSRWAEIEVYPSAKFHNRSVTVMKIPQGNGRWLKGHMMEDASGFFTYLGQFLRLELSVPE